MLDKLRGADILTRTLDKAGMHQIFTLSGNHIMEIFDASIGTNLKLTHVRHEGAAVLMAGAWGQMTGNVGLAMVTGGPGHTNAVSALCTPLASEMPMVLLSGHAPITELGRGSFQELPQIEMAATITKAAWMVESATELGHDVALAIKIAGSGRPGPVHLSLPSDILEELIDDSPELWPAKSDFLVQEQPLSDYAADAVIAALMKARRPVILVGPHLCTAPGRMAQRKLEAKLKVPVVGMESPRGLNDPCLGAFAEELQIADLIVLLGKPLDFTIKFGDCPAIDEKCKFIVIDPDVSLIERTSVSKAGRLIHSAVADSLPAVASLSERGCDIGDETWQSAVHDAINFRPSNWKNITGTEGALHALDICRSIQNFMNEHPNIVLVCDGGEIGQWSQANLDSDRRIINGVAGSIGSATPFALAARIAEKNDPVITIMGDGTFGFHMAEFDTAVRNKLPLIAIVGNDACWNAEHQIQIRNYGKSRTHACELLPTRYDQVVESLGGHGELVTKIDDLRGAIERSYVSGKPACVNVMIENIAAPIIRRN